MGIPFYFQNIITKNNSILENTISRCTHLFLDFNSIIHNCSATIVKNNPQYTYENIFDDIIKTTLAITNLCKPSILLFIAVDGVAPRAKIQQQRRRRYITAYKNDAINEFKKKNLIEISNWDSNCITPGTEFMEKLNIYISNFFEQNKFDFNVTISGHDVFGEGEHKIIKYIKKSNESDNIYVINGLDADLIMLSLSCEKNNIFLMRDMQTSSIEYKYINIDTFRKCISKFLYNSTEIAYMYDYIFICFLIGNDFIPSLSFLKIRYGALDLLCDTYKKVYEQLKNNLIVKNNNIFVVNYKFLNLLFEYLSNKESTAMITAIDNYNKLTINPKRTNNKYDLFVNELENYPLIHKFPDHFINPKIDQNWRSKYYYYLFNTKDISIINKCSINYIEGLLWVTNYYFNNNVDKNWYYKYDFGPSMLDLYTYLSSFENDDNLKKLQFKLQKTNGIEINSLMQMLMVLPLQSYSIIPKEYQYIMTSIKDGCTHFYPITYKFSTFLKSQLWECHPILPDINMDRLHKSISLIT